jgi:hypothetical protein
MKQPLYALLIAPIPEMRQAILNGVKKITIREGHRDYRIDCPVMLCCHLEPWAVMADVVDVRHTTLEEISEEEYVADGFQSSEEMLSGMKRFYPNLSMNSPVTVIRWDNVRGILFDKN